MAAAYYQTVSKAFEHFYYAQMARDRLAELGQVEPADVALLSNIHREEIPALTDDVQKMMSMSSKRGCWPMPD